MRFCSLCVVKSGTPWSPPRLGSQVGAVELPVRDLLLLAHGEHVGVVGVQRQRIDAAHALSEGLSARLGLQVRLVDTR